MKKGLIIFSILTCITLTIVFVLDVRIMHYKFLMSGELNNYSSTITSNFYEISYVTQGNSNNFDIGKAKFRVIFTGIDDELEELKSIEVDFAFDDYFSGTLRRQNEIPRTIVKINSSEIIKELAESYKVIVRTNEKIHEIELRKDNR